MITKDIQKLAKSMAELSITMPWTDIAPKWNEVVAKVNSEVELPGFRKGQAPVEMVEQQQMQQIQSQFLQAVMPQGVMEALQGTDIVPIDYPQYQVLSFAKGSDLSFKARVTHRPIVTVGAYKTIKVARPAVKVVTDAEVQKIIDDLFKRYKARPQALQTQPQPPTQGLSGSMNFNSQANAAAPVTSDSPDDNFAKAMGAQDFQDLKQKIKLDLEDEAKYNNELDYEEAILQEVEKITTVDIPDVLIQDELNRMLVSLQRRVADMGLLLDDYLRNQNKTLEQLKGEWKPQAEKNVKMELGLSEIARTENVVITDQELQAEIDKVQDARLKQQFESQEPRMHLRHALRQTRTLNLLKSLLGPA